MRKMSQNPFKQSPKTWEISIELEDESKISPYTIIFEDFCESYSIFEDDTALPKKWEIKGYLSNIDDINHLKEAFKKLFADSIAEKLKIAELEDIDWVLECQKNFRPIEAGKFFIHSNFYKEDVNLTNKIAVEIDPGRAFGTGEHETTQLCLEAMSNIKGEPSSILDLGCGSGILAICASKIFTAEIIASDIDEVSVLVARENSVKNGSESIIFEVASGFTSEKLNQKFDLIIANILTNPLIELAEEIKDHLVPGGTVILSGFTQDDAEKLIVVYEVLGLKFLQKYSKNNWCSLVFA